MEKYLPKDGCFTKKELLDFVKGIHGNTPIKIKVNGWEYKTNAFQIDNEGVLKICYEKRSKGV